MENSFFQISAKSGGRVPGTFERIDAPVQVDLIDLERCTLGKDETGEVGDLVNTDDLLICIRDLLRSRRRQNRIFYRFISDSWLGIFINYLNCLFLCCFIAGGRGGSLLCSLTAQKFTKRLPYIPSPIRVSGSAGGFCDIRAN